jgi:hypothetical protein
VGGGCRGRLLAGDLSSDGHAVRITTRREAARPLIEAAGAECWIGDPDRIATLRDSLDRVTVACWMLGTARGDAAALHGTRLEHWLSRVIDTTVRGFVYEASGTVAQSLLLGGERIVRDACLHNAIPLVVLSADPAESDAWRAQARAGIDALLS